MRRYVLPLAFVSLTLTASAQRLDPVQWALTCGFACARRIPCSSLHLKATMQEGWHLYSLTTPNGGPIQTTAGLTENSAITAVKFYQPPPKRKFDPNFNIDTETFEKDAMFPIAGRLGTTLRS